MAVLPRAICLVCKRLVPVRRNGAFREHNLLGIRDSVKCAGSGETSEDQEARDAD